MALAALRGMHLSIIQLVPFGEGTDSPSIFIIFEIANYKNR